jgi:L,D-peptidoglycan transpeptidase YkuD (ErfK/YbiS/YcfS/YnhG family)
MRWLIATAAAGLLSLAPAPVAVSAVPAVPAQIAHTTDVVLGGVTVHLHAGTRQVVTVNRGRGYHARVTWWVRRHDGWVSALVARDGRIGYGGLVAGDRRVQGTGTTPLGTYRLISSFGTHLRRDGWALDYRRIRRGDYWVEDNGSRFYNRYRSRSQGGFRWWLPASATNSSERLTDFPVQYEYSVVTGFNRAQVRRRGAGIFLHVNGPGATAGCVSAPRWFLRAVLGRIDPAWRPVIAIGR